MVSFEDIPIEVAWTYILPHLGIKEHCALAACSKHCDELINNLDLRPRHLALFHSHRRERLGSCDPGPTFAFPSQSWTPDGQSLALEHKSYVEIWSFDVTGVTGSAGVTNVSGARDGNASWRIWEPRQDCRPVCVQRVFLPDSDSSHITCFYWSPDGRRFAVKTDHNVYTCKYDRVQSTFDPCVYGASQTPNSACAWLSNNSTLFVNVYRHREIATMPTNDVLRAVLRRHDHFCSPVVQYDIDSDGCSFVKREYATPDQHLVNCVHTSWTSPIHGQYVATRALNTVIWKVDQSTSQLTLVCALHQGFGFPCAKELAWAPQQLILAVLQADRVLLWNAVLGGFHPVVLLWDLRPQMAGSAISGFNVAWSPDGRRLAITTVGGNVWVWDLPDLDHVCAEDLLTVDDVGYGMDVSGWGLFPQHHFRHEGNLIHGWVHWSHDGQLLAYGTFTTGVPIWHVETNQLVTCLPVKYSGLCWSPTCNRIALNVNGVPYLWG